MTITDTHPEAERILTMLLRKAPVWRKLQMMGDLNRTANHLALEGLRDRFPNATESELQRQLADLLLGPELAPKSLRATTGAFPGQIENRIMNEQVFVTLLVVNVFERLDIPYLIGGSFASTAYGHVRTTQHVDIVASMEPDHVDAFVKALDSAFYLDEVTVRKAILQRTNFNLIHLETMFKVDVIVPKERPFDQQQLARRFKRVIDKDSAREVYFASPEDTILAKLEWYRLGGEESEIQWRDINSILQQQSEQLDFEYLKDTAKVM